MILFIDKAVNEPLEAYSVNLVSSKTGCGERTLFAKETDGDDSYPAPESNMIYSNI